MQGSLNVYATVQRRSIVCAGVIFGVSLLTGTAVEGQTGSGKTITIQVGYSAGGGNDVLARIVAPRLAELLGQPVVVENRPGASGAIAAQYTARAAPDGQTLLIGGMDLGYNPIINPKLGYDLWRDFVAVAPIASTPLVLVAHPSLSANTPGEIVALANAKPSQLNYGSAGAGSGSHMGAELFRYVTKVDIVHIAYKGSSASVTDLVGGQVQLVFTTLPTVVPLVKAGKLKVIAVTSAQRTPVLPEVPTFVESGLSDISWAYWFGFFAPAGTPKAVQARLHDAVATVMRMPDVVASLDKAALQPMTGTTEEFTAFIKKDLDRWAAVVKAANIKMD